jgi:hypothetical protein
LDLGRGRWLATGACQVSHSPYACSLTTYTSPPRKRVPVANTRASLQSCIRACLCGWTMLRSLWRRWAPASWQQKSSTGAPARHVLPFPLIFSRAGVMQLQEAHPAQHSFQRLARRVSRPPPPHNHYNSRVGLDPPPPRLLPPQTQLLQQRLCPPVPHSDCIYRYRDSGGLDTKRGSEEHEQLLRSCGWAIRAEDMEVFLMAKDITGRQLLSSSWCCPPSLRKSSQGAAFPTQRQVRYGLQQRRQLSV